LVFFVVVVENMICLQKVIVGIRSKCRSCRTVIDFCWMSYEICYDCVNKYRHERRKNNENNRPK